VTTLIGISPELRNIPAYKRNALKKENATQAAGIGVLLKATSVRSFASCRSRRALIRAESPPFAFGLCWTANSPPTAQTAPFWPLWFGATSLVQRSTSAAPPSAIYAVRLTLTSFVFLVTQRCS
jgi:hypothetical protein